MKDRLVRLLSQHFPERLAALRRLKGEAMRLRSLEHVFTQIHRNGEWDCGESTSGSGSTLRETSAIRAALPALFADLGVRSMLDIPCGDFNWMKALLPELSLPQYVGADLVADIVRHNHRRFATRSIRFVQLNAARQALPEVDLILCRDLLVHLSLRDARRAVRNMQVSGSRYLLATTFPSVGRNDDIVTGSWRPLNLAHSPFELGRPLCLVDECCPSAPDKHLGLWRLAGEDAQQAA